MNGRRALGTGAFAGAACAACCAPPIIAALGLTVGLAATAAVMIGIAAAIAVVLLGLGFVGVRRYAYRNDEPCATEDVPVALGLTRPDGGSTDS